LLGVTVVPFPTAVLAEHLGGPDENAAAIGSKAKFILIAIAINLLWQNAVKKGLLNKDGLKSAANIYRQEAVGPIIYARSLVLAWFSVKVSVVANVALALYFALPPSLMKKHDSTIHP